jgi:hypothetical protein
VSVRQGKVLTNYTVPRRFGKFLGNLPDKHGMSMDAQSPIVRFGGAGPRFRPASVDKGVV